MFYFFCILILFQNINVSTNLRFKLRMKSNTYDLKVQNQNSIRPLGSYEKLMARKIPGTNKVALSHGAVYIVDGKIDQKFFLEAIAYCIKKHPMLRVFIDSDSDSDSDPEKNNQPVWKYCPGENMNLAKEIVSFRNLESKDRSFESEWKSLFEEALNSPSFPDKGPLWRLDCIQSYEDKVYKNAWIFTMNHAIDDQQSVNIVASDILNIYSMIHQGKRVIEPKSIPFPDTMEKAVAPEPIGWKTLQWSIYQLGNAISGALVLPKELSSILKAATSMTKVGTEKYSIDKRRTTIETFKLNREILDKIKLYSKSNNVTVTQFLSAAIIFLTDFIILDTQSEDYNFPTRNLRFLLSVGLRPYSSIKFNNQNNVDSENDWTGGTVACAGGAIDYIIPVKRNLLAGLSKDPSSLNDKTSSYIWELARKCRYKSFSAVEKGFIQESVRLFDFGMKFVDILQAVEIAGNNKLTLGREYSCGVSNVGVVMLNKENKLNKDKKENKNNIFSNIFSKVIRNSASDVLVPIAAYYGTSHSRNGVLCQLSCQTLEGELFGCLQFPDPIISQSNAKIYCQKLIDFLENL